MGADGDSLPSRTSIKETCADIDRETVLSSLLGSTSKGKRDRDQNVVQAWRDRQNLHKILERNAELAVRGEKLAQQRLCWADVEVTHWEKRNSDLALILRSIRSSSPNDYSYNRLINGLIRLKEIKISLYRENQTKDCQEIDELRRICCEETDRARQAGIDELSMHQERNSTTVPGTVSSSGATHVPSEPSTISSPGTMPCRDSGLPHNTRNVVGTSGNFF